MVENVPRILASNLCAELHATSWPLLPLFQWLQQAGNVKTSEMHRVFNCGIGMAIVVSPQHAMRAQKVLEGLGETVYQIGTIQARKPGTPQTAIV